MEKDFGTTMEPSPVYKRDKWLTFWSKFISDCNSFYTICGSNFNRTTGSEPLYLYLIYYFYGGKKKSKGLASGFGICIPPIVNAFSGTGLRSVVMIFN